MEPHFESIIHTKKIRHDMVILQKQLVELKRNAGLLSSEALHHQLRLMLDSLDQRLLGPSTLLDVNLKNKYLNLMNKKAEVQQKVSLSGLSEVKGGVKRVAGFVHESESPSPPKRHKQQQDDETDDSRPVNELFKLYETEGTVGDTAYAAAFVMKRTPYQKGEKVADLEDLSLGTQSIVAKKMLTPGRVSMPETVSYFTTNLYYHKVLLEERDEALDYLESEVPGVEVVRGTEPVVLQLLSHGQHEVEVEWELVWEEKNSRFKYSILVNCSEEVVARYSTADIYPYLSRQQKLQTPLDVISFAETFTEL